jgi:hypothetical protein
VFVPRSAKAMAEVHELLDVPSQLISSKKVNQIVD